MKYFKKLLVSKVKKKKKQNKQTNKKQTETAQHIGREKTHIQHHTISEHWKKTDDPTFSEGVS